MSEHRGGTVEAGDRCPSCGARVAASQPWCTLCHTRSDARPGATGETHLEPGEPGEPGESREPGPVGVGRREDPGADGPDEAVPTAVGPDPVAGAPSTLPPGAAEAMLAELARSTADQRPLARGPLAGRSRAVTTALAVGAALVLTVLGVGLLTLLGLLL